MFYVILAIYYEGGSAVLRIDCNGNLQFPTTTPVTTQPPAGTTTQSSGVPGMYMSVPFDNRGQDNGK